MHLCATPLLFGQVSDANMACTCNEGVVSPRHLCMRRWNDGAGCRPGRAPPVTSPGSPSRSNLALCDDIVIRVTRDAVVISLGNPSAMAMATAICLEFRSVPSPNPRHHFGGRTLPGRCWMMRAQATRTSTGLTLISPPTRLVYTWSEE